MPKTSSGCRDRYETKTIGMAKKGFPVWEKTTMIGPNGTESFSTTNEVIEFSQATLDPSLFDVPEGYREVQDFASAFAAAYGTAGANNPSNNESATSGAVPSTASTANNPTTPALSPKRAGVIRLGVVAVKAGNVAEGMNASELALAVRNTLLQQLKGTNVEAVPIETTGAAIQAEAQQKECDYVVYSNVSHKKGGGGFGSMLGNSASSIASSVGYGHGTAAAVTANAASAVVVQSIKAKDELTLDVRLERPGSTTPSFAQQFKGKAKSAGEDIITPLVQQASQAAIQAVGKQ
jgi:hypothetical protein